MFYNYICNSQVIHVTLLLLLIGFDRYSFATSSSDLVGTRRRASSRSKKKKPAAAAPAAPLAPVEGASLLPSGWVALTSPEGSTYYSHAKSSTVSWKAPDAQGWIEELDASSGRTYFCNAELGRTQWDDPRAIGHSGETHVVAAAEAKEVLWAVGTSLFHHAIDRPAERAPRHTFKAAATAVRATRRMSMLGTSRVEAQRQADALAAVEAVPVVLALASDGSLLPNGWKEGTTGTGLVYVIRFVLSWYISLLIMCIHIRSPTFAFMSGTTFAQRRASRGGHRLALRCR